MNYKNGQKSAQTLLAIFLLLICALVLLTPVQAKRWTIYQRQLQHHAWITKGLKSGDLTLKEATSLREKEADIARKAEEMKARNGGKLSYKDQEKLERELNRLSILIHKQKLAKRMLR